MYSQRMLLEVIFTAKLRTAVFAVKRFAVHMRCHMSAECRPRQELGLTEITGELTSERMTSCMLALLLFRREGFSTHRAEVGLPGVHGDVKLHCFAAGKPASTVFTAIRLFSRVNTNVFHQFERAAQHLSAHLSDIYF